VRQLVELHGGSVSAYSEGPGRGSTIKVELPIPAVLEEPGSWLRRRTGVPQAVGRLDGLDILVVDDESEACEAVRAILEQYGARVAVATSASEALAKVAQDPPDVLLADIAMPGTDGCELMRRIRAMDSATRTVPAAALSAYGTEHLQRAVEAGYQLFLSKPIAAEELATSLLKLVAKHRSEGHA
jgi:CheY-like chemotaxis protein